MSRVYNLVRVASKPIPGAVTQPRTIELRGVGKWGVVSAARYIVANEYICAKLGEFIGLPIPPFAIVQGKGSRPDPWFVSLDFNLTGQPLPDAEPEECVSKFPRETVGIVLFDAWIANSDRHPGNISLDQPQGRSPRINVFDHSHALFGVDGPGRLTNVVEKVGITETANTGAHRHCLLDEIRDEELFDDWFKRIELTPDFLIDDSCAVVADLGILTLGEKELAAQFLKRRRSTLRAIVLSALAEFRGIQKPSLMWRVRQDVA